MSDDNFVFPWSPDLTLEEVRAFEMDATAIRRACSAQEGRVAAAWWGAAISRLGSGSAGAVDIDLLRMLTAPEPLGEDARRRFEAHLAAWIDARLDKGHRVRLGVDYAPDGPDGSALVSALDAAGVIAAPWPLKTRMWIERGSVVVCGGYGASYERLLGAPVWCTRLFVDPQIRGGQRVLDVYEGPDEADARSMFAMAVSVLPSDLESGVLLTRDDNTMARAGTWRWSGR